jgi:hypothetical protein
MSDSIYRQRLASYERGRRIAVAIGTTPLLAVYFLVHTPWLESLMQKHRHLVVAALIVLPLAWLWALAQGWRRYAPRRLGLLCDACGGSIAEPNRRRGDGIARCPHCGAEIAEA